MNIPWRILLADDSIDDQFLLKRALHRILPPGSSIRAMSSGNQAIAYMIGEGEFSDRKRYPFPNLVIPDHNMHDGDDFDVLEFLRSNPAWSIIPRIIFSSSKNDDDVRTAFLLGASAYHLKGETRADWKNNSDKFSNIGRPRKSRQWMRPGDCSKQGARRDGALVIHN